jgi:lantibiotic biosynthesis protein
MCMRAVPVGDAPVPQKVTGASRRPLLSGPLNDQARRLAGALNQTHRLPSTPAHNDASLASGAAGLAVCSGQLARTRSDQQAADTALTHLEEAIGMLATEPLTSSLYSGFIGIAWAVELVDQLLGVEGEYRDAEIDDVLSTLLQRYPDHAPYDLINGLTGLGVYALARWPRLGAVACVLGVVEQLAKRARHDSAGVFWWTPVPRRHPYWPGGVDLGVAHGIAGVIPFLARVHRLGLAQGTVRPLLDGAVSWLLAHMVDTASGPTVPYFVTKGVEPAPARSAWCYGDPGVAAALLLAAQDVGEPAWAAAATGLAVRAAARPHDQTGVTDAGLCHGSAGLAHLFNRMYEMTAEPALAEAARFWIERTLELCPVTGPGRDATFTDTRWPACQGSGLLEGTAGVALAMEAASTTVEPLWDQMLLVSNVGTAGRHSR